MPLAASLKNLADRHHAAGAAEGQRELRHDQGAALERAAGRLHVVAPADVVLEQLVEDRAVGRRDSERVVVGGGQPRGGPAEQEAPVRVGLREHRAEVALARTGSAAPASRSSAGSACPSTTSRRRCRPARSRCCCRCSRRGGMRSRPGSGGPSPGRASSRGSPSPELRALDPVGRDAARVRVDDLPALHGQPVDLARVP